MSGTPPNTPGGRRGPDLHRKARYYRMPRRTPRWVAIGLWGMWLGIAVVAGTLWAGYSFVEETIATISPDTKRVKAARKVVDRVEPGKPINILLVGSDTRGKAQGDPGRSDSIILVRMDSQLGFISMLSFARDLYVNIPGVGTDKINSAYTYGEQSGDGGPAKVIQTVQELTGQKVNAYVNVDFKGFAKLVDEIGGVYIDVDRRYFNDNSGPGPSYEMIDIEPGYQRLNGDDALDYVRYRHTDSDFARIVRQQTFLSELKRRTRGELSQGPRFVRLIADNAETSIDDSGQLLNIIRRAIDTPDERVHRVQVNGSPDLVNGVSLNRLNQSELQDAIQSWLTPEFLNSSAGVKVDPATTRVAVLNGSGRSLVGEDMAGLLRGRGYLATSGGNADSFGYSNSTVLFDERSPKSVAAARALKTLISPSAGIEAAPASRLAGADVAVVVGTDFAGALYTPPKPARPPAPDVVSTARLVPIFRNISSTTGMPLMAPLKVARGSSVRQIKVYRINTGSGKGPWAVKIVFQRFSGGANQYWGITATQMKDPPILQGPTGTLKKGSGLVPLKTFYNGRHLTRESFEFRGVRYWITNALDKDRALTAETIHEISRSFRPAATAKLPRGETDAGLSVEYDAPTP